MDDVGKLQAAIKLRLAETGMTQAELAEKIFVEDHEEDDDSALACFIEALKKQLNRKSTPPEKLRRYLEILLSDKRGLEGRYPAIASSQLPKQVLDQLHQLSAEIDGLLQRR